MRRRRALVRLPAALATVALLKACGEVGGPTAPPPGERSLRPPVTVAVRPRTSALTALGETVQLSAVVHDRYATVIAATAIRWTTSDGEVATVDASGLVTAERVNGTATITADVRLSSSLGGSSGSWSGSAEVTVRRRVASVEVTPAAEIVYVGHTLPLSAEPLDESGYAVTGTGFSWRSSDSAVASVESMGSSGLVRGVAPGLATITVTADRVQATVEITVVPDPERVALSDLDIQTEGTNWSNHDSWLTDVPLGAWHGVVTDDPDRVVTLGWDANELRRRIPPALGTRVRLTGSAEF